MAFMISISGSKKKNMFCSDLGDFLMYWWHNSLIGNSIGLVVCFDYFIF